MHLHLLLNLSAFRNWPGGSNTTLDFIVRILLRHSGCLLWTSPKVSTPRGLEFNTVSVSASSVINNSSFNDLPCVFKRDNRMVRADWIRLSKNIPYDWLMVGFCTKWCNLHQNFEGNTESSDGPFFLKAFPSSFCAPTNLDPLSLLRNLMYPSF